MTAYDRHPDLLGFWANLALEVDEIDRALISVTDVGAHVHYGALMIRASAGEDLAANLRRFADRVDDAVDKGPGVVDGDEDAEVDA